MANKKSNSSVGALDENLEIHWGYLTLVVVPVICVVGNCMVIAAVWRTKALQTPTNYLLVSLAIADLIIGLFAMPFSIYLSLNSLHWHLSVSVCQFYCTVDVAASTSSIVHMVLISIDRFVAAAKPADYKTSKHRSRTYAAILTAWCFSIALSLPLGTSLNTNTGQYILNEHHCGIYSPIYMFCSSIFAFFIPCSVMVVTYGYIFHVLRRRLRTIRLREMAGGQLFGFGADVGNITESATQKSGMNRTIITWEKPFLKSIEESAAEHASSLNDSEREQLQTIFEVQESEDSVSEELRRPSLILDAVTISGNDVALRKSRVEMESMSRMARSHSEILNIPHVVRRSLQTSISYVNGSRHFFIPRHSLPVTPGKNNLLQPPQMNRSKMRRLSSIITDWERAGRSSLSDFTRFYALAHRESFYSAKRKLAGLKNWALDLVARLRLKQGVAIRREKRATKLVAVVLVAFLICWLPFFTLNTVKVYKLIYSSWPTELEVWFHWFTALGYLNSSLNFFIYFAINKKFRTTFCRMLRIGRKRKNSTLRTMHTVTETRFTLRGTLKQRCHIPVRWKRSRINSASRKCVAPVIVIQEATNDNSTPPHPSISNEECATFRHTDEDDADANAKEKATFLDPKSCFAERAKQHLQLNSCCYNNRYLWNDKETLV